MGVRGLESLMERKEFGGTKIVSIGDAAKQHKTWKRIICLNGQTRLVLGEVANLFIGFLHYDYVQEFHNVLRENGYHGHRAFELAHYLTEFPHLNQKAILSQIEKEFTDPRVPRLLKESLASYDIDRLGLSDSKIRCLKDRNWDEILQIIVKKHKNSEFPLFIYNAAVLQIYTCGESREDYTNIKLPPNQMVLKKLRQKMYGILLLEKPLPKRGNHQVRELVVTGPFTLKKFVLVDLIPPQIRHHGLLNLWEDGENRDFQWDILCSTIGADSRKVRRIQDKYIVPSLSLFYLLEEGVQIERWEARAIVSSIVTLVYYSTGKLDRLNVTSIDPRAVHLYTLLTRTFKAVYELNAVCGFPVPNDKTFFSLYQDGKLFHTKYAKAKIGIIERQLCENMETAIVSYRLMMDLLES